MDKLSEAIATAKEIMALEQQLSSLRGHLSSLESELLESRVEVQAAGNGKWIGSDDEVPFFRLSPEPEEGRVEGFVLGFEKIEDEPDLYLEINSEGRRRLIKVENINEGHLIPVPN